MHLLLALSLVVAYPFDGTTIERSDVRSCFDHLLAAGYFGRGQWERAAFLVLRDDGSLACHDWPASFAFKSERWDGPVPAGTVAIANTHPASIRQPSAADVTAAANLGIPVFVLTPGCVTMASPRGEVTMYRTEPRPHAGAPP